MIRYRNLTVPERIVLLALLRMRDKAKSSKLIVSNYDIQAEVFNYHGVVNTHDKVEDEIRCLERRGYLEIVKPESLHGREMFIKFLDPALEHEEAVLKDYYPWFIRDAKNAYSGFTNNEPDGIPDKVFDFMFEVIASQTDKSYNVQLTRVVSLANVREMYHSYELMKFREIALMILVRLKMIPKYTVEHLLVINKWQEKGVE